MSDIATERSKSNCWNYALRALGIVFLLGGAWHTFSTAGVLPRGITLIGTSLVLFLFSAFDELKSFSISISKVLELQGQTRDVVNEAKDVTRELRALANILGAETLKLLIGGQRYGSGARSDEVFDRAEAIVSALKSIGLTDGELAAITAGVRRWIIVDYCEVISKLAEAKRGPETNPEWEEFWSHWRNTIERPSPQVLQNWLHKNRWLDGDIAAWVEDYRIFFETGKHNRPESFRTRSLLKFKDK